MADMNEKRKSTGSIPDLTPYLDEWRALAERMQVESVGKPTPNNGVKMQESGIHALFCHRCGKRLIAGGDFCPYCGTKIAVIQGESTNIFQEATTSPSVSAPNIPMTSQNINNLSTQRVTSTSVHATTNNTVATKKKRDFSWLVGLGIVVLVIIAIGASGWGTENNNNQTTTQTVTSYTPIPVSNGQILKYPIDECVAPFEVKTSSGSNYYVYLKDINGRNDMAFYITGGNTVEVDVPLGSYTCYYCSGDTWYGRTHKFGDNTYGAKADDIFRFYIDGDYYMGHTVTLYKVTNGNLSTSYVDMDDFPG